MGKCSAYIKEIRYLFDGEDGNGMMHIYVLGKAWGDCPVGSSGWFHKVLPPGSTMMDEEASCQYYLMWDRGAPPSLQPLQEKENANPHAQEGRKNPVWR